MLSVEESNLDGLTCSETSADVAAAQLGTKQSDSDLRWGWALSTESFYRSEELKPYNIGDPPRFQSYGSTIPIDGPGISPLRSIYPYSVLLLHPMVYPSKKPTPHVSPRGWGSII